MSAPSGDQKSEVLWPDFTKFMTEKLKQSKGTDPTTATLAIYASLIRTLCGRIDQLEARAKALETLPLRYEGPHQVGRAYDKGAMVTHQGGIFHCNYETTSRPGDGPAWTLAVKRGRDAR